MHIGVPKEIKNHEYRVGLTPAGVRELIDLGHKVSIQTRAGAAIGFRDEDYQQAGAEITPSPEAIFEHADLIIKVKEPQPDECRQLHADQIIFTYLHLAPDPEQTRLLLASGVTAIAYETVTDSQGRLPLLAPMSEVAGRLSIQAGAHCLEKAQGGNGMLLGGVPGVEPAKVLIIGAGVVGLNAARMASGLGANVTLIDRNLERLSAIDDTYQGLFNTLFSTTDAIERHLKISDLVVGAVLIPGAETPKLVSEQQLDLMRPGSVLVDVAIDQGGCFETSRPTTHDNPTYKIKDIVHYCVANMPGAVARTATLALTNATLPYIIQLANGGLACLNENPSFMAGVNIHKGKVTNEAVARAQGYSYTNWSKYP